MYDRSYYDSWGIGNADTATERMKLATFHEKLDAIERSMPGKGRILDIGCATGFFLEAARSRGWEPFGVELSPYSSGIARERIGGDRIVTGTVETASFPDSFFDAVVMTDVIEHIADVRPFMAEVARILKQDGIAVITTPNPASLSRRMMGSHWPHYKREHLLYFTPRSLSLLMEPFGFRRERLTAATKTLTVAYLDLQLRTYPLPLITTLMNALVGLLPGKLRQALFRIHSGELFDISRLHKGSGK